jgi:hypothetical protein
MKAPKIDAVRLVSAAAILSCTFCGTAAAFNAFRDGSGQPIKHDNSQPIGFYINLGSYASAGDKADLIQGIRNAFQHVQDNPFINVTFNYLGETTTLPGTDQVSVVYLDGDRSYVGSSAGVTTGYNINPSTRILSADIALNGLTHSAPPYVNLYALTLHELCHFLGLGHSSSGKDSAVFESTVNLQLSPDDIAGLATLYPDPASPLATQRGTVRGRVTTADGVPFPARVIAYDLSKAQPRVVTIDTNADGTYELPGLPAGSYNFVAETLSESFLHIHALNGVNQAVVAGTLLEARDMAITSPGHFRLNSQVGLEEVAVHPVTGDYYSTRGYYGPVKAIDHATGAELASISVQTDDLAFTADGRRLVIASQIDRRVAVIDTEVGSPTLHQVLGEVTNLPAQPIGIVTLGNTMAYVSCNGGGAVVAVNLTTLSIAATITTNEYNQDITLSPDGTRVYLGTFSGPYNWLEIDVVPASPTYHTIVRKLSAGTNGAWQVRPDAAGQRVFIATSSGVDVRRRSDNVLLAQIPGGRAAYGGLALTPDGAWLAFLGQDTADLRNNELLIVNTTTLAVVERIAVGGGVDYVSPSGLPDEFLVSGQGGITVVRPAVLTGPAFTVAPLAYQVRSTFSGGLIDVQATNSAAWEALNTEPWIKLKHTLFRGSGSLEFVLDPNLTALPRAAVVTVAGQSVSIVQGGVEESPLFTIPPHASAVLGSPLSLAPTATSHVEQFGAVGLPPGLSIDPVTGQISGTPTALGTFVVTVSAANAAGASYRECSILVTTSALPDLVIESAKILGFTPTHVTYEWTIRNSSTVPAVVASPGVIFQAYLSADTVAGNSGDLGAGGFYIGAVSLQSGEARAFTQTSSRTTGSSTHPYLVAKIDNGSHLAEANENNNTFALPIEGLDFNLWKKAGRFTVAEQGNASISGPDADPDRDGRTNWMEYAFDFNPRAPDPQAHAWLSHMLSPQVRPNPEYSFRVPAVERKDVLYELRASNDLQTWGTLATKSGTNTWQGLGAPQAIQADGQWNRLPVIDPQPLAGAAQRFISIKASSPPP